MATITEDYVSFETAWLLKEKGFNWECFGYYVDYKPDDVKYSLLGETNSTWEARCCSAPTLQMAMKWLREEHNIYVNIWSVWDATHWLYQVFVVTPKTARNSYVDKILYSSYEQAVEEGIKYCLENLI